MTGENRIYITASELAEMLGVSVGRAYKIIRKLNQELAEQGEPGHCRQSSQTLFRKTLVWLQCVERRGKT